LEPLSNLHSKLPLKKRPTPAEARRVSVWEKITLSFERDVPIQVECKPTTKAWFGLQWTRKNLPRRVLEEVTGSDRQRRKLSSNFQLRWVSFTLGTSASGKHQTSEDDAAGVPAY